MAEQVTPLIGSPLSQESRQTIARSTSVSGQTIRGANLLAPIAPTETEIKNLQVSQKNQESLFEIRGGLFGIQQDINKLNTGLINVATLLQQDAINEERLLRSQQERERRYAEEQIRIGREGDIERKIENAIVQPVQRIAPKVQDIFGNVLSSLGWLFGGWLTNQVIEYIKTEGEGNNERMQEIKNNIIKNLGVAGGVLLAIKIGIGALRITLSGITKSLGSLIGKAVTAPFSGLKGVVQNILPGSTPSGTKPGSSPKPGGGILSGLKNLGGGIKNSAGNFIKGMGLPLLTGSIMTGLDIKSGENPGRAVAGTVGGMVTSGAAFAAGSLLPIPGSGLISGALGYQPGADFAKGIYDKFFQSSETNTTTQPNPTTPSPEAVVSPESTKSTTTPTENLMGKKQEPYENKQTLETNQQQNPTQLDNNLLPIQNQLISEMKLIMPSENLVGKNSEPIQPNLNNIESKINFPDYSNIFNLQVNKSSQQILNSVTQDNQLPLLDVKNVFDNQENISQPNIDENLILPSQPQKDQQNTINSIPTKNFNIGELPDPKPNIVYASTNSSSDSSSYGASSSGPVGSSAVLADIPVILPNNPDNFHVMLAYSIYNVTL
jgi:hypothetical protein